MKKVGNLKVLKVVWMQGDRQGQIGIVATKDTVTKEYKYFVGYVKNYSVKLTEDDDIKEIIAWGTKFTKDEFIHNFAEIMT